MDANTRYPVLLSMSEHVTFLGSGLVGGCWSKHGHVMEGVKSTLPLSTDTNFYVGVAVGELCEEK